MKQVNRVGGTRDASWKTLTVASDMQRNGNERGGESAAQRILISDTRLRHEYPSPPRPALYGRRARFNVIFAPPPPRANFRKRISGPRASTRRPFTGRELFKSANVFPFTPLRAALEESTRFVSWKVERFVESAIIDYRPVRQLAFQITLYRLTKDCRASVGRFFRKIVKL